MESESGVDQTSILAFHSIPPEKLRGLQREVYGVILQKGHIPDRLGALLSKHPRTGDSIAINVYVPRRNELMHNDRVRMAFEKKDPDTGNLVKWWEVGNNVYRM